MQETNRIDSAETADSIMRINIPHYGIDLRVILLAISDHLPYRKLIFGPKINERADVVVPTLKSKFTTNPKNGFLIIQYRKRKVKVPMKIENRELSEDTIDIISAYLERIKINYPIP
jgi:hypothetical protein